MLPSLSNLFSIRQDHQRLIAMVEESDGELTPEIEAALQVNQRELSEYSVSLAYVAKSYDLTEQAIEEEIKRLQKLKETSLKRAKFFKQQIANAMNQFHVEVIQGETIRLSFRKADSVLVEDERLIPMEYFAQPPPILSKLSVKDALKAGKHVPGACIVTNRHLQIR